MPELFSRDMVESISTRELQLAIKAACKKHFGSTGMASAGPKVP